MKLLTEIIELLGSDKPDLNSALFKTKVLMHKMGQKKAREWVDSKINGYKESAVLPSYRILEVTVFGNVSNGYTRHTNMPLTTLHLDEKLRDIMNTADLRQSIAVIEEYSKSDDLVMPVEPALAGELGKVFSAGFRLERTWREPSAGAMLQVVNEVRSSLLDFVLDLSDSFPEEIDTAEMKLASKEKGVEGMFQNAVFGANTTIVVGDNNNQNISNAITTNDFQSLAAVLIAHSVKESDVLALQAAVASDVNSPNHEHQNYGENVQQWYHAMLDKAADLAWNVNTGVAGSLLATALNSYYGWI